MEIALVPFSGQDIAEDVFFELSEIFPFNFKFNLLKPLPLPGDSYNPERNQYRSDTLKEILKTVAVSNKYFKVVGLANVDIYCGNSSFVFGHSDLNGKSAVVSAYRLNGDDNKVVERTVKIALHELGHLFGLKHCNSNCVMKFCETAKQVDERSSEFCRSCLEELFMKDIKKNEKQK